MNSRRPPQRTCIACRQTNDKRTLIRLVRSPTGGVEVDLSGKMPGRGAYLCHSRSCWQTALKKNRLEHALGTELEAKNRQLLIDYGQDLSKGS